MKYPILFSLIVLLLCGSVFAQKASDVQSAFEAAKLPIVDLVVYTDETDPNDFLGRPNGYIAKFSWYDSRVAEKAESPDCTVEIFANKSDLNRRKKYIERLSDSLPVLGQYMFVHKNILLRLPRDLTPAQAKEYADALLKI